MRLFDSNIIIYSALPEFAWLRPYLKAPDSRVSALTRVESLGFHQLPAIDREYFEALFQQLHLLPVTDAVLLRAVQLRQERKMGLGDSIVAATALEAKLPELITRNIKDFAHLSALRVLNPIDVPGAGGISP